MTLKAKRKGGGGDYVWFLFFKTILENSFRKQRIPFWCSLKHVLEEFNKLHQIEISQIHHNQIMLTALLACCYGFCLSTRDFL